jgi:nitrogen fixation-related uncharacterized protein
MEIIISLIVASALAVAVNGIAILISRAATKNDDDKAERK